MPPMLWYHAILAASLASSLLIGLYTIYIKPRSPVNRLFFVLMMSLAVHLAGDLFFQLSRTLEEAGFWLQFSWIGYFLMPLLFYYFTTIYPKNKNLLFKQGYAKLFLSIIPLYFLYAYYFTSDFVSGIILDSSFVNYIVYGSVYPVVVFYIGFFLYLGIYNLYLQFKETILEDVKRVLFIIITVVGVWSAVAIVLDAYLLEVFGHGQLKLAAIFLMAFSWSIGYGVFKHNLLVIEPVVEEARLMGKERKGPYGGIHYMVEDSPDKSLRVFSELVFSGRQGLCLSTIHPKEVRKMTGLKTTPVLQVCVDGSESQGVCFKASELDNTLHFFLDKAKKPVVFFHGFSPLIKFNRPRELFDVLVSNARFAEEMNAPVIVALSKKEKTLIDAFNSISELERELLILEKNYLKHRLSAKEFTELTLKKQRQLVGLEAGARQASEEIRTGVEKRGSERLKSILEKRVMVLNYKFGKGLIGQTAFKELVKETNSALAEVEAKLLSRR